MENCTFAVATFATFAVDVFFQICTFARVVFAHSVGVMFAHFVCPPKKKKKKKKKKNIDNFIVTA